MGPGHMDQGTPVGLMDFQDVDSDQVALGIFLPRNLLAGPEHRVRGVIALTDADEHIAGTGINAQDSAGQQLLGLTGVGLIHHAPLGFPDALDDHLLGGLGGDAAKFGDVHRDVDGVSNLGVGVNAPGGVDVDFQGDVLQLLHGGLYLEHAQAGLIQVHHHVVGGNVPVILPVLAVGVGEGLLQPLHHVVNGDALELLQVPQTCENFCADVHLGCFGLLFGSGISCHGLSSCQNSTRSRTRATWDFSKVMVSLPASTVTFPSS